MKNLFRLLMAALVICATSCTKEDVSSTVVGEGEVIEVTFTAGLADLGTRATTGTGAKVNKLYCKVFDNENDNELTELNTDATRGTDGKFTFRVVMVKGMTYDLVLWAECETNDFNAYQINGKEVTVTYNGAANDERYDAFCKFVDGFNPVTDNPAFTLTRPLAQLNAATNDKAAVNASGIELTTSEVTISAFHSFNIAEGTASDKRNATFAAAAIPGGDLNTNTDYEYLAVNYLFVSGDSSLVDAEYTFKGTKADTSVVTFTGTDYSAIPLKPNHRTNILGALLTKPADFVVDINAGWDGVINEEDGVSSMVVNSAEELQSALEMGIDVITLGEDIDLSVLTRAVVDPTLTIAKGKEITIDLGGFTLSSTSTQTGKNYNMFDVRGTLTVKNGNITTEHTGTNMEWNNSTNVFHIEGGVLNLVDVTAKNLGGSDMAFVAHLNNWGECTLNVDNSTLECANYVAVRIFNSGPNMNNVNIQNSDIKGANYALWVHNYTDADFGGNATKAAAQRALLNLNIDQNNSFSPVANSIRYGMTNKVVADVCGISKSVSEDGAVVNLTSIVDNGVVRRYVAGEEKNSTIKEVVVGEGVVSLPDRTFRQFYALETIVLPSTLTTLGSVGEDYYSNGAVFQGCAALKNVVIPESVTTMGPAVFYGCTALESVNIPAGVTRIEKDCLRETGLKKIEFPTSVTYFGEYAFRDSEALEEIIINAPEFTVEPNTFLNAAAPYPTFTIHVVNAKMKDYLNSKLTDHQKTFITVVAPNVATNDSELGDILASEGIVEIADGNYTLPSVNDKDVTISGSKDVVMTIGKPNYSGSDVTLNGITVKGSGYSTGIQHVKTVTYNDVTIVGEMCLYGEKVVFNNCTFELNNQYVWTYGAAEVEFNNCTFNTNGKAILIYNEGDDASNVSVKGCTFNATAGAKAGAIANQNCAAVEIDNFQSSGIGTAHSLVTEGNTYSENFSGEWRIKNYVAGNAVTVNGVEYTQIAVDGKPMIIDSNKNVTVLEGCYINGTTYSVVSGVGFKNVATYILSDSKKDVTIELADNIDLAGIEWPAVMTAAKFVLDGKGYSIKNLTTSAVENHGFWSTAMFTTTRKATTIKNLVVENATVTGNGVSDSLGAVLVACNYSSLTIDGVTVKNSTVSNCDRSSIIAAYLYFTDAIVNNCVVEDCTINSIGTAGALLGINNGHNFTMTNNSVKATTISSSEGNNKAGILIGTWQKAGALTQSGNTVESSKAINAGTETNKNIGREV